MYVLDRPDQTIEVVLGGAHTTTAPTFMSSYEDGGGPSPQYGSTDGVLNGNTAVTLVTAPSASYRKVHNMSVCNVDSVAATLTVNLNNQDGTLRRLFQAILAVDEQAIFSTGIGWQVIGPNGELKTNATFASSVVSFANGAQDHGHEARTATVGGGTTGLITQGTRFVTITSAAATSQVSLPAAVIGDEITLYVGANGCEIISVVAADQINNVVVGATNELAMAATSFMHLRYWAATDWSANGWTTAGVISATMTPDSL